MEGPVRRKIRQRVRERAGLRLPELPQGPIDSGGRARTDSLAAAARPAAPLLLVLHGGGGTGLGMAALTGLWERGPAAGFAAVFPDGFGHVWNDQRNAPRLKRREGIDDVAFLRALVERLAADGVADADAVFGVGISNGSLMSEHLARPSLLPVRGLALVAGPATSATRAASAVPAHPAEVVMFHGTADPIVPYAGGPIRPLGGLGSRGDAERRAGRGGVAPVETVAADWATANGCPPEPVVETLPVSAGDLPVTRFTWTAPGHPAVVLHRIEGGGHTWPGGEQYLPPRLVGTVARLDATGIVLERFSACAGLEPPGPR